MVIVRPVRTEDLLAVMEMAERSGFGLTNLPKDPDILNRIIRQSVESFRASSEKDLRASYLFVMEDQHTGCLVGTGGITSRVGVGEPFYAYRIETHVHESSSLGIRKDVPCLHLLTIENGPSEIGALFLHPDYRKHGLGRLISLCRFLFIAEHPGRFSDEVIAEMRGMSDEQGQSPLWEALGRHFFDIDFPKADYLTLRDKRFIAELMPRHPIYVTLLPEGARSVIGQVHRDTIPALNLLLEEGFKRSGMIDIFDGGPILTCPRKDVRVVAESLEQTYLGVGDPEPGQAPWLLSKGRLGDFRACIAPGIKTEEKGIRLSRPFAEALRMESGDTVRFAPLRPKKEEDRGEDSAVGR